MPKGGEYIRFKNYERKIKSPFMIYIESESILVSENNGKRNPYESYKQIKYQKHVASSYGNKLVCVDAKLGKPFKSCLGENVVYYLINRIVEKSKY